MGKRKRIRIQVGELGALIKQREESKKKMFGEIVTDIMQEVQCSWTEAKKIYKHRKVERAIKRELQNL
mgnify:CR=1 FL=1|tara:strand:- start:993 stop:1196 length:204 start_codon:yes stop_codon:yes gene_type:complete